MFTKNRTAIIVVICISFFTVIHQLTDAASSASAPSIWQWEETTIGTNQQSRNLKIAADDNGTVHAIMPDSGVVYSELTSTWGNTATLDTQSANASSIGVDNGNSPIVVYASPMQLTYASITGTGWVTQSLGLDADEVSDIIIDANGKPSFAYRAGNSLFLMIMNTSNVWLRESVPLNCSIEAPTLSLLAVSFDIAIANNGSTHLAYGCNSYTYNDLNFSEAYIATFTNGQWVSQEIELDVSSTLYTAFSGLSLGLDSNEMPHVLFGAPGTGAGESERPALLAHWQLINSSAEVEIIASFITPYNRGFDVSRIIVPYELVIDSTDTIHATYAATSSDGRGNEFGNLNYLSKNSNGTVSQPISNIYVNVLIGKYEIVQNHQLELDSANVPTILISYLFIESGFDEPKSTVRKLNASPPIKLFLPVIMSK